MGWGFAPYATTTTVLAQSLALATTTTATTVTTTATAILFATKPVSVAARPARFRSTVGPRQICVAKMGKTDGTITNARGQKLHTVAWVPAAPKAVVMWHHGVGEYADRMSEGEQPLASPVRWRCSVLASLLVVCIELHRGDGWSACGALRRYPPLLFPNDSRQLPQRWPTPTSRCTASTHMVMVKVSPRRTAGASLWRSSATW